MSELLVTVRRNLIPLLHSVLSLLLFSALTWFFIRERPDPDYNDILSVMIGALVTIVTIMFSAVLVALQLASAQFSPRVTRAFFGQNRRVQSAFYLFLFGIAYCLAIKFTYSATENIFRYPALPVTGAVFGFFLISFVLPRFVFYIADAINAASITRDIALRTLGEIDHLYGKAMWQPGDMAPVIAVKPDQYLFEIEADQPGFLDRIDHHFLCRIARKYPGYTFYSEVITGNFITQHEILLHYHHPDGAPLPDAVCQQIRRAFVTYKYRSYEQDVLFGVRQLVDIGIKAISPAVNDPTTCVNSLHYLGVIARRYAHARVPSLAVQQAPANIHFREFGFSLMLDAAFDQIYQWGRGDYVIVSQLLQALTEVARDLPNPAYQQVLVHQVEEFQIRPESFDLPEHQHRVKNALARFYAQIPPNAFQSDVS